jgi:hypothetical protein
LAEKGGRDAFTQLALGTQGLPQTVFYRRLMII